MSLIIMALFALPVSFDAFALDSLIPPLLFQTRRGGRPSGMPSHLAWTFMWASFPQPSRIQGLSISQPQPQEPRPPSSLQLAHYPKSLQNDFGIFPKEYGSNTVHDAVESIIFIWQLLFNLQWKSIFLKLCMPVWKKIRSMFSGFSCHQCRNVWQLFLIKTHLMIN